MRLYYVTQLRYNKAWLLKRENAMFAEKIFMEHVGPSTAVALAGKKRKEPKIDPQKIKRCLSYNHETGDFTWIGINKHHKEKSGLKAGVVSNGYVVIQVYGVKFRAHRLAWLFVFGYMPEIVDHINGITIDNRIANLRDVTSLENAQNHKKIKSDISLKKSGLPVGVKLLKSGLYQARATVSGKCYALGSFKTAGEAHEKYREFTKRKHDNPAVC